MKKLSKSFVTGAIALVFAVLGYQTALLVHYSAVAAIVEGKQSACDTVKDTSCLIVPLQHSGVRGSVHPRTEVAGGAQTERLYQPSLLGLKKNRVLGGVEGRSPEAHGHHYAAAAIKNQYRKTESFRFNPNTASIEDLQRLGFSEKQAQSIDNYRQKGGHFRRKEDFASSYVVADSVYKRLEMYIDIPKLDINQADSAAFDSLPGIGGYFAKKMVEYRAQLRGYSYPEQLMDIYHFDREKYDKLADLIEVGKCAPYPLWTLPADSLRMHPYIRSMAVARAIVLYRSHNPDSLLSVQGLMAAGIINRENAEKLSRCFIAEP